MEEEQVQTKGGWITFPFIIGTIAGLSLAGAGWLFNLTVYLINEFNIESIDAAQISNIVNGFTSLFPIVGAVLADSFMGPFSVIAISASVSLLGTILLALTATLETFRPKKCHDGFCTNPSKNQLAILYTALALTSIGLGGTRFTLSTIGAAQFDKPRDQNTFFNWSIAIMYVASVMGLTVVVYTEDNLSWKLGFGLCAAANFAGLLLFLAGKRFYFWEKPHGSPFAGMARVIVAALRKRKVEISCRSEDYYREVEQSRLEEAAAIPRKSFRFLNRAALKTQGDTNPDGSIAKPWRLCTVQQVEDLKAIIRTLPIWSSSISLATSIAIQSSLSVLQALAMDRHLGPRFQVPAGSIMVIVFISTSISIAIIDRFMWPTCKYLFGRAPSPLQRIGTGHVLNLAGMAVSALVESNRLKLVHTQKPQMPVLWLFPQLVLVGMGEAFHFPGQVALYYQEFPVSLKNSSMVLMALIIGIAFYLGSAVIDLIRKQTGWLPNDINQGKMDNVYWVSAAACVVNVGYFLVCSMRYRYSKNPEKENEESS